MKFYDINTGDAPLVATAIHDGHDLREELERISGLDSLSRLKEEDPFTGEWTKIAANRIVVSTSRFEVDLNRAREKAVYVKPEDAWGLNVWSAAPSTEMINRSLVKYDSFYSEVEKVLSDLQHKFGKFIVFDIHSYNYRRDGRDAQPAEAIGNPEVNIGTGTMLDRSRWAPVIDRFISDLSHVNFLGRRLDVRENVKFYGGNFPGWIHKRFPKSACVLSIEFKKFFMDEWSGRPDAKQVSAILAALQSTIPGVMEALKNL